MDSNASSLLISSQPPPLEYPSQTQRDHQASFIDSSFLHQQTIVPKQFIWPKGDLEAAHQELMEPLVDLEGYFNGDEEETLRAATLIRAACMKHGFFQVINHGVDLDLIGIACEQMDQIFRLPVEEKVRAQRMLGSLWGYAGAHADRYMSKLPWKETFSFGFHENCSKPVVVDFFKSVLGNDFEPTGIIFQKYCEGMKKLSQGIMELLAISLGVERRRYMNFFEDGVSIMRCNFYPPCQDPSLALGTGPHCDPTSLTILHQDHVGGLQVFADNVWQTVPPRQHALVINIGDTFMALSNGVYKSCVHRAVVNKYNERKSLAYFLCPREDKVVRAPEDIVIMSGKRRLYPDFTWSDFFLFTQTHYRPDVSTLLNFTTCLLSSNFLPPPNL